MSSLLCLLFGRLSRGFFVPHLGSFLQTVQSLTHTFANFGGNQSLRIAMALSRLLRQLSRAIKLSGRLVRGFAGLLHLRLVQLLSRLVAGLRGLLRRTCRLLSRS